ncbi:MAG TPA: dTDP-4-amino-4,6-dideoxygalactose transaminase [Bacteroidota bacterium]|nr:dTDP-4-amino-4,6-dideoxygalactose transaminase [Bacteroidota bacterium]
MPQPIRNIPLNVPYVDDALASYLNEVIVAKKFSGDGVICKRVETRLREQFSLKHVLLTTSCTHALEMAAMVLDLNKGDEVIVPSFTFVSSANAVIRAEGTPVFCDIDRTTLTMDIADVKAKITPRTRAIMPVHYAGISADMDPLMALAQERNLSIIEDAAQGVGAKYNDRYLGGIGNMGAFSFHDTKNLMCGEGGAFVTNDEAIARRAEIIREKGTNRSNFLRGEVDKYTWVAHGSSYILSDLLAAVLLHQLDRMEVIQQRRKDIYVRYNEEFRALGASGKLVLPTIPANCASNYHLYHILLPHEAERNRVMGELKKRGIGAAFHYVPLHQSPYAQEFLGTKGLRLPVTEDVAARLLRIPLYPGMSSDDIEYIVKNVKEIVH